MDLIIKRIPLSAFCIYLTKIAINGAISTQEVCILAILTTMACFFEYKLNSREMRALEKSVEEYKDLLDQNAKEIGELKVHLAGFKMSLGMKAFNVNKTG